MSDLPRGWAWTKLGEVATVGYGKGLPMKQRDGLGDIPVLGSAGVAGRHTKALVEEPAIIIGRKGNAGAVWSTDGPSWPIDTTYFVQLPFGVDRAFLAYQLRHLDLGRLDSSTAIPSLRREDLQTCAVVLPPRAEQERIVVALEEHLSRLDAAEASMTSVNRRMRALEWSILARAQSDGKRMQLGALLNDIEAGKSFKTPGGPAGPDEWGVIKVSAMTWGEFDESENKAVPQDQAIDARYEIHCGDLLLSRANTSEYVGATVLVGPCRSRLLLSDKSMRLLPREGVDRQWLRYALGSPQVRSQMSALATGTSDSMRNISQAKVRALWVRTPPPDRQTTLALEIDTALRSRRRIERDLRASHARAAMLRRSILAAAFSGQLVPQVPDDEPAFVLLERIRAKRATAAPKKRGRGAKAS